MKITIHVKLEGPKAVEIIEKAMEYVKARDTAMENLKKASGCDEVLISHGFGRTDLHIGFKTRQDDPIYHKKKGYAAGYHIHTCKNGAIASARDQATKLANSEPDLDTLVTAEFPEFSGEVVGSNGRGVTIRRASFGSKKSMIFGGVPYKKGIVIPDGWVELSALEFAKLTGEDDE